MQFVAPTAMGQGSSDDHLHGHAKEFVQPDGQNHSDSFPARRSAGPLRCLEKDLAQLFGNSLILLDRVLNAVSTTS